MGMVKRLPADNKTRFPIDIVQNDVGAPDPNVRHTRGDYLEPALVEALFPGQRHPLIDGLIEFGSRNSSGLTDPVTGKSATRFIQPYVADGGSIRGAAEQIDGEMGLTEAYLALPPTYVRTTVVTSGGSGYTSGGSSTAIATFSGGGSHPDKELPQANVVVSDGVVTSVPLTRRGKHITAPVTCTISDPGKVGGTDAVIDVRLNYSIVRCVITAGGLYSARPTATVPNILVGSDTCTPRLRAIRQAGGGDQPIIAVDILDGGFGLDETNAAVTNVGGELRLPITFGGVGPGGATGYAVLGYACPRAVALQDFGAPKTADATVTIANPLGGTGASIGYRVGQAPTESANYISTVAGATGDAFDRNGILIPQLDDNNFIVWAIIKFASGRQFLMGTDTATQTAHGFGFRNNAGTLQGYDFNSRGSYTTVTKPAALVAGEWGLYMYGVRGEAGDYGTSGNFRFQNYHSRFQCGQATALTQTGRRYAVRPPRPVGVGATWFANGDYNTSVDIAEVGWVDRAWSDAEFETIRDWIIARNAALSTPIVIAAT